MPRWFRPKNAVKIFPHFLRFIFAHLLYKARKSFLDFFLFAANP